MATRAHWDKMVSSAISDYNSKLRANHQNKLAMEGGGMIPGPINRSTGDDIDIKAKKGEYIFPVDVVDIIGRDTLDTMVSNIKTTMGLDDPTGHLGDNAGIPSSMDSKASKVVKPDSGPMFFNGGLLQAPNQSYGVFTNPNDANDYIRGLRDEKIDPAYVNGGEIKPIFMSGQDKYNMSFVGKADPSNPSYKNAMMDRMDFGLKNPIQTVKPDGTTSGPKPIFMSGQDKYNMSFVGKADPSNPSYKNAMMERSDFGLKNPIAGTDPMKPLMGGSFENGGFTGMDVQDKVLSEYPLDPPNLAPITPMSSSPVGIPSEPPMSSVSTPSVDESQLIDWSKRSDVPLIDKAAPKALKPTKPTKITEPTPMYDAQKAEREATRMAQQIETDKNYDTYMANEKKKMPGIQRASLERDLSDVVNAKSSMINEHAAAIENGAGTYINGVRMRDNTDTAIDMRTEALDSKMGGIKDQLATNQVDIVNQQNAEGLFGATKTPINDFTTFAAGAKEQIVKDHPDWSPAQVAGEIQRLHSEQTLSGRKEMVEHSAKVKATANDSGTAMLSPEAIEDAARTYVSTGSLPTGLGYGQKAMAIRSQIMNRGSALAREQGLTSWDPTRAKLAFAGDRVAATALSKQFAMVDNFEKTAQANLDEVLKLSDKVARTMPIKTLADLEMKLKGNVIGDPEVRVFYSTLYETLVEYGKVVTGNFSAVGLSDSGRKEMDHLLQVSDNPETFRQTIAQFKVLMQNRINSIKSSHQDVLDKYGKGPSGVGSRGPHVSEQPSTLNVGGNAAPASVAPAAPKAFSALEIAQARDFNAKFGPDKGKEMFRKWIVSREKNGVRGQ